QLRSPFFRRADRRRSFCAVDGRPCGYDEATRRSFHAFTSRRYVPAISAAACLASVVPDKNAAAGSHTTERPIANPTAVAHEATAANQRSIVGRSAPLPRMIWRTDGRAAMAASTIRAPAAEGLPSIFQKS